MVSANDVASPPHGGRFPQGCPGVASPVGVLCSTVARRLRASSECPGQRLGSTRGHRARRDLPRPHARARLCPPRPTTVVDTDTTGLRKQSICYVALDRKRVLTGAIAVPDASRVPANEPTQTSQRADTFHCESEHQEGTFRCDRSATAAPHASTQAGRGRGGHPCTRPSVGKFARSTLRGVSPPKVSEQKREGSHGAVCRDANYSIMCRSKHWERSLC